MPHRVLVEIARVGICELSYPYLAINLLKFKLNLAHDLSKAQIYRKPGRVTWYQDRIEVVLDPYAYRDQQRVMEATCQRFNAANLRWRDGRLLRITMRRPGKF
jgi:hypothetical protein